MGAPMVRLRWTPQPVRRKRVMRKLMELRQGASPSLQLVRILTSLRVSWRTQRKGIAAHLRALEQMFDTVELCDDFAQVGGVQLVVDIFCEAPSVAGLRVLLVLSRFGRAVKEHMCAHDGIHRVVGALHGDLADAAVDLLVELQIGNPANSDTLRAGLLHLVASDDSDRRRLGALSISAIVSEDSPSFVPGSAAAYATECVPVFVALLGCGDCRATREGVRILRAFLPVAHLRVPVVASMLRTLDDCAASQDAKISACEVLLDLVARFAEAPPSDSSRVARFALRMLRVLVRVLTSTEVSRELARVLARLLGALYELGDDQGALHSLLRRLVGSNPDYLAALVWNADKFGDLFLDDSTFADAMRRVAATLFANQDDDAEFMAPAPANVASVFLTEAEVLPQTTDPPPVDHRVMTLPTALRVVVRRPRPAGAIRRLRHKSRFLRGEFRLTASHLESTIVSEPWSTKLSLPIIPKRALPPPVDALTPSEFEAARGVRRHRALRPVSPPHPSGIFGILSAGSAPAYDLV